MESNVEMTAWEYGHKYGYKSVGGSFPVEGYGLFEAKDDGTELTMHMKMQAGSFFKVAEGLVAKQMEKQLDASFDALKLVLESEEINAA